MADELERWQNDGALFIGWSMKYLGLDISSGLDLA